MMKKFVVGGLCVAASLNAACTDTAESAARAPVQYYSNPGSPAPFSTAVRVGDILYLSGQIGMRPDGSFPDGLQAQTRLAMDNIAAALQLAGSSMDAVFKCTAMLDDMSQWAEFNEAYIDYFEPGRLPARSSFGADGLALGALVEIECLAYGAPAAGD
jgi:reactive intermediate/imine deaminase